MARPKYHIPMDRLEITAYRFFGMIGSCFTLFQSVIWLLLSLLGAACSHASCGAKATKSTFKYCFYMYYFNNQNVTTRMNYITPPLFQGIMWVSVLMCIGNIVVSAFAAKAFITWINPKEIKRWSCVWTRCILAFSLVELLICVMFFTDALAIKQKDEAKCFLKKDLKTLLSADIKEPSPAPYLLNLKSKMQMMQKRIKKLKRNLLILDAVMDEKNRNYVNNPFMAKGIVNTYIEDVWRQMFNSNIRKKVRRKTAKLPFDEDIRNFIIKEHLTLDDIDYDLLRNFDSLTNHKWNHPMDMENDQTFLGKEFNFSPSIMSDDSNEMYKIASLLHEYMNETEMANKTNFELNSENLDVFLKSLLSEFDKQDPYNVPNKIKFTPNESVLADLNETVKLNTTLKLNSTNVTGISAPEEVHVKKVNTSVDTSKKKNWKHDKMGPRRRAGTASQTDYIKDLCENCVFFVLSPSIFCMVMALKTIVVWVINIVMAVLVWFYGNRTKIKRKRRIWPCKK